MIDIFVLTGFLGSGKTTLLREVLSEGDRGTGLIVNEFGEIGVDHLLLNEVSPGTVVLPNGCLCCAVNQEFIASVRSMIAASRDPNSPTLRRIVIETTGLADPRPVISSLMALANEEDINFAGLVTVVDAINAFSQRTQQPEWLPQVIAANLLIISKSDLIDVAQLVELKKILYKLNPLAQVLDKNAGAVGMSMFEALPRGADAPVSERRFNLLQPASQVHEGVETLSITHDGTLSWMRLSMWLMLLLRRHGDKILRFKAVLWDEEDPEPFIVHAVQHLVYAPTHLKAWQGTSRRSTLVLIVRGIDIGEIHRSLRVFVGIS